MTVRVKEKQRADHFKSWQRCAFCPLTVREGQPAVYYTQNGRERVAHEACYDEAVREKKIDPTT